MTHKGTVKWRDTEMESEADKASEQQEFVGGRKIMKLRYNGKVKQ